MQTRNTPLLRNLALAVMLAAVAMPAGAATYRQHALTAASVCNMALPAQQSQISVRPVGIYNAGPHAAYVSCSLPVDVNSDVRTDEAAFTIGARIQLVLLNFSQNVTRKAICNVTGGYRNGSATGSSQTAIMGGGNAAVLTWDHIDRFDVLGSINISCILPPGVELGHINLTEYDADNEL